MIIPPEYLQANILFTGIGAPTGAEVTLGFNRELWGGSAKLAAQNIREQWQTTAMRALFGAGVNVAGVMVKFGPNATGPSAEDLAPLSGTASGATASPNVTYLIRKNTGFGGRTGRGRMYLPGVVEGAVNEGGAITAAQVTSMTNALEAMRTALIAIGLVPTLLHGAASPVQVPMPITSFTPDTVAATQRRRMRR